MDETLIEGTQPAGLTTRELAERLGKTPQTVRNWTREGMPCLSEGGLNRPGRFDEAACRRWIAAHKSGLGRGGERERAGRTPNKKRRKKREWREGPSPLLEDAEKKKRANERLAELAGTTGAQAAVDPEVVALERDVCKLTHADLVLLAHLIPDVSGLTGGAVQRLEKLETIQSRQLERHKAAGRLLDAGHVRQTYEAVFGELRARIDASAKDTAGELAAALELDGEGHKRVEKVLKERAAGLVASLREVGSAEAAA